MIEKVLKLCLFSLCFITFSVVHGAENEVDNLSFENGRKKTLLQWQKKRYSGKAEFIWSQEAKSGARSAALFSTDGADVAMRTKISVKPYSLYRLTGWIKTENVKSEYGLGAHFKVHGVTGGDSEPFIGTHDWTRVELEFPSAHHSTVTIEVGLGGHRQATGKAWFDDLNLTLLKSLDITRPEVTVDLESEIGRISPYIYGQFIEHAGRCIYGGIWAEMLQDRKFFELIAAKKKSPWNRFGDEIGWSLTMDVERPYANGWSSKITVTERAKNVPHGIMQDGLAVVKGKEYTGHVVVAGSGILEATLTWADEPKASSTVVISDIDSDFSKKPIRFKAGASTKNASLSLAVRGPGKVWIGAVSLMPADNIKGMRTDTIGLLKKLGATTYRWPGGNFVSGYDWRDGLGPRDKRPTRKNPAWKGLEDNDFGIDEFITFCREVGAEPQVVVNSGTGSPELAAQELEYCNGKADTEWGRRRGENGHVAPYDLKWWGIGNEMWGGFQLGNIPIDDYVLRHNEFVTEMRKVDPDIKPVAVGALGRNLWSEKILSNCADTTDMISEHFYIKGGRNKLQDHVFAMPEAIERKAKWQRLLWRTIPALKGKKIPISLDEWNYWYGDEIYGELGVRYYLRDALGIAAAIHEMAANPDVFYMANYAQTVNVIGCIKTNETDAAFATTALPLMLYRKHFGSVALKVSKPTGPFHVMAALTADRKKITIGLVNVAKEETEIKINILAGKLASKAKRYIITGKDEMAYNEPGKPQNVTISEPDNVPFDPTAVPIPPLSVTMYIVDILR
ncbi:MAG: alpha-L-arabinofuranosidase C-terminal domain-containing protein [Planctomycetota bacterium]|jgi:alpha-N-arabinofuranosidase